MNYKVTMLFMIKFQAYDVPKSANVLRDETLSCAVHVMISFIHSEGIHTRWAECQHSTR